MLQSSNYADSLHMTFFSTLQNGLRSGGGIGDSISNPAKGF